jgi:hypothetical protein
MNQKPTKFQSNGKSIRIISAVLLAGACTSTVWAANIPSGTVSGSGSGVYT